MRGGYLCSVEDAAVINVMSQKPQEEIVVVVFCNDPSVKKDRIFYYTKVHNFVAISLVLFSC